MTMLSLTSPVQRDQAPPRSLVQEEEKKGTSAALNQASIDVTPGDGSEPEAARGGQAEQILPLVNHKGIVPATNKASKGSPKKGLYDPGLQEQVAAALLAILAKHTGEPTFAELEMHFHVENKN